MAISPNTTFVSGAILTAAQQNAFGYGIVAFGSQTTTQNGISTETQIVASSSFTAIANRYYRITFVVPRYFKSSTAEVKCRIRKTSTAGTQLQSMDETVSGSTVGESVCIVVTTLTAGSQVVIGSMACDAGSLASEPSATQPALIIVEDIGPA